MIHFTLLVLSLFSTAAFACEAKDIQIPFRRAYTSESTHRFCRDDGGAVSPILAPYGVGVLSNDPSTSIADIAIKCVNGETLVGTITMDTTTSRGRTIFIEKTAQVFP